MIGYRVNLIYFDTAQGGYCLDSLAEGAALTLSALLGDPCPKLLDPISKPSLR